MDDEHRSEQQGRGAGDRPATGMAHLPGPRLAPCPTLEELWDRHGGWMEGAAARSLGGDARLVHAACHHAMLRVARHLSTRPSPEPGADLRPLLGHALERAVEAIHSGRIDPAAMGDRPLPDGLPASLRHEFAVRAEREAEELALEERGATGPLAEAMVRHWRRLREEFDRWYGFPVALLVGRRLRQVGDRAGELLRSVQRRGQVEVASASSSASPGLTSLLAVTPGITEAAVVTAMVAFGLGGGAAMAAPPPPTQATTPVTALAYVSELPTLPAPARPPEPADRATPGVAAADSAEERDSETVLAAKPDESSPDPVPIEVSPPDAQPKVAANSGAQSAEPVRREPYDNGERFILNEGSKSVDADGDGSDEVTVGTPIVGVGCGHPEQGVVTGATCEVLEASS